MIILSQNHLYRSPSQSFLLKTMERVVLNFIESTALKSNPIHKNQHAFRQGSSCETALSDMVNNVESMILRGKYALGIFLDIAGAFDNLDPTIAVQGMVKKDICPDIVRWYQHYLMNRQMCTMVKGISISRALTCGTLPGRSAESSNLESGI